jgi:hypothetical protein
MEWWVGVTIVLVFVYILGFYLNYGCQPHAWQEYKNFGNLTMTKKACEELGGKIAPYSFGSTHDRSDNMTGVCFLPTKDFGKSCSNSSECEAYCVISTNETRNILFYDLCGYASAIGKCSEWKISTSNCLPIVTEGKIYKETECVTIN